MGNSMFNNKQRKPIYLHAISLIMLLICLSSTLAHAVCGMDEEDDYYGNAETCPFKSAVEGTEGLNPSDIAFLNAVNATRIINRWYMRLMVGKPKLRLTNFENESSGIFANQAISEAGINQTLTQVTLAGGYFWETWAMEFEILFSKRFNGSLTENFGGTPITASVELNQVAAFINAQYVIPRLFSWYPRRLQVHLDAGVGGALKSTNSTLTIGAISPISGSTRNISAAANLGLGARYQVTANVLVDVAYRYFFLGKTTFGPIASGGNELQISAKTTQTNGFFAGAVYQF